MKPIEPEPFYFRDDGITPNNSLPVLVYRNVFQDSDKEYAPLLEKKFQENNWTGNWRDIVMTENHYHSTTHEVLGISRGLVRLLLGGEKGKVFEVMAVDMLVIPAGVAHSSLRNDNDYEVVGGYPDGLAWKMIYGEPEKYENAKKAISLLEPPTKEQLFGGEGPLIRLWK